MTGGPCDITGDPQQVVLGSQQPEPLPPWKYWYFRQKNGRSQQQ
jgi:hypothetical protein